MTKLVGILNLTPDSFYDGGQYNQVDTAVNRIEELIAQGAQVVDIGGQSTKPHAIRITSGEELQRVQPLFEVLPVLCDSYPEVEFSIDTFYGSVAREAIKAGCTIINDVSGFSDPAILSLLQEHKNVTGVLMYSRREHNKSPCAMKQYFSFRLRELEALGCTNVYLDPGLGFGMGALLNTQVLTSLDELQALGKPLFLGPSHKSFSPAFASDLDFERKNDYLDAVVYSGYKDVDYLRVHDVSLCGEAVALGKKLQKNSS
jgi:dihydropteroate synthase